MKSALRNMLAIAGTLAFFLTTSHGAAAQNKRNNPWGLLDHNGQLGAGICCTSAQIESDARREQERLSPQRYTPQGYATHGAPAVPVRQPRTESCVWRGPVGGIGHLKPFESSPTCAPTRYMGH